MTISGTLNIGKNGLLAHQRAISVTSHNIANVNTPGYTRQRPVFYSVAPAHLPDGFPLGGGVEIGDVERMVDRTIEAQLQQQHEQFAYDATLQKGLTRIEAIFEEMAGVGMSATLSKFFSALNDLANDPANPTIRNHVIQQAETLVTQIHDADYRLSQLQVDVNSEIQRSVAEVNGLARDLAELNQRIFAKEITGATASALRDRRNELLTELGEKVDFSAFERPDGNMAIFVGGGFLLVDGHTAAQLEANTNQPTPLNEPYYLNIYQSLDGVSAGPITSRISGGELGALLDLRDTRTEAYRDMLDEFAFTLADRVNTEHLNGRGLVDANARRFFIDPSLGGGPVPGDAIAVVEGAAAAIEINGDLLADPRHLAAGDASPNATPPGAALAGDNANALRLAAVELDNSSFYRVGDVAGSPTGPSQYLGSFLDSLSGTIGSELQATQRDLDQGELIIAQLEDQRGIISGVSIDEEVTKLIAFQRAFQANARVIQTVDEMLETLLAM